MPTAIYSAETLVQIEHIRALLQSEGIRTTVKNQYLSAGWGELPAFDCWPELWLVNERDAERARCLLREYLQPEDSHSQDWLCAHCGERIEGQFGQCWNCGADKPV